MTQQEQTIQSLTELSDFIDYHGVKEGVIAHIRILVENDIPIEKAKQWAYDSLLKCERNVQVSTALNLFEQHVITEGFDEKELDMILENIGFDYGFIVDEPKANNPCLYFLCEYEDENTPLGILGIMVEISEL